MHVVRAPADPAGSPRPWVFAAGSIDMGRAQRWQRRLAELLADVPGSLLDPRRDDWDPSWPSDPGPGPLRSQVEWELAGLDAADLVVLYFEPASRSPITLLELGLTARAVAAGRQRAAVCCGPAFWRAANVAITAERYRVARTSTLDGLAAWVRGHCPAGRCEALRPAPRRV